MAYSSDPAIFLRAIETVKDIQAAYSANAASLVARRIALRSEEVPTRDELDSQIAALANMSERLNEVLKVIDTRMRQDARRPSPPDERG